MALTGFSRPVPYRCILDSRAGRPMKTLFLVVMTILSSYSLALDKLDDEKLSKEQVSSASDPKTPPTATSQPTPNTEVGQGTLNKAIQADDIKYAPPPIPGLPRYERW